MSYLERSEQILLDYAHLFAELQGLFVRRTFLGIPTWQPPWDAWIMQEIICETRPERIVETGTLYGGSAVMWALLLEQLDIEGRVVTVDLSDLSAQHGQQHPVSQRRIDFVHGSSVEAETIDQVRGTVDGYRTMVILDSEHHAAHVREELDLYASFVSPGCYLIVQDGLVSKIAPEHGPGPLEAVQDFLAVDDRFEVSEDERMIPSFNPSGYLLRREEASAPPEGSTAIEPAGAAST